MAIEKPKLTAPNSLDCSEQISHPKVETDLIWSLHSVHRLHVTWTALKMCSVSLMKNQFAENGGKRSIFRKRKFPNIIYSLIHIKEFILKKQILSMSLWRQACHQSTVCPRRRRSQGRKEATWHGPRSTQTDAALLAGVGLHRGALPLCTGSAVRAESTLKGCLWVFMVSCLNNSLIQYEFISV